MTDSNAIRDAINAIADRAHPPQRIRAAVEARSRFYRQRRLVLRTTGAAATAAVAGIGGVGVYRLTRRGGTGFPSIVGGPGGGWLHAEPRWRPGWLPDGFGLTSLGAVVDGDTAVVATRTWTRPQQTGQRTTPFIGLTTGWSDPYAPGSVTGETRAVDVDGTAGELRTLDDGAGVWLTWQPAGEPKLTVSVSLPGADSEEERAVATRVAESLRRDPETVPIGPRAGWLPPEFATRPWMFTLAELDGTWAQHITVSTPSTELIVAMGPGVGRSWNTDGGRQIRIGGVDAWLGPDNSAWLLMPFPGGIDVLVSTFTTGADLVRIVENLDVGPVPDMTWYGGR